MPKAKPPHLDAPAFGLHYSYSRHLHILNIVPGTPVNIGYTFVIILVSRTATWLFLEVFTKIFIESLWRPEYWLQSSPHFDYGFRATAFIDLTRYQLKPRVDSRARIDTYRAASSLDTTALSTSSSHRFWARWVKSRISTTELSDANAPADQGYE